MSFIYAGAVRPSCRFLLHHEFSYVIDFHSGILRKKIKGINDVHIHLALDAFIVICI